MYPEVGSKMPLAPYHVRAKLSCLKIRQMLRCPSGVRNMRNLIPRTVSFRCRVVCEFQSSPVRLSPCPYRSLEQLRGSNGHLHFAGTRGWR